MRVLSVRKHATVRRRWQVHLKQEARERRREGKDKAKETKKKNPENRESSARVGPPTAIRRGPEDVEGTTYVSRGAGCADRARCRS